MALRYRRPIRKAAFPGLGPNVTGVTALTTGAKRAATAGARPDVASSTTAAPVPPEAEKAMLAEGMDNVQPLSPGRPLSPFWGPGTPPRAWDYPQSVNITTRPRAVPSRMSFDTLKQILRSYDVSRMCIEHRADDIRALDWRIVAADGVHEDVSEAIATAKKRMRKPDGTTPFDSWQNSFLEDVLSYDAGTLFKGRLRSGAYAALEVVDGTTMIPLLDYDGRRPDSDAPAFTQAVHGLAGMWFRSDTMIYQPFRLQPDSVYGLPPIEWMMLGANTDLRFQAHFLAYFTEGTLPAAFMESPPEYAHPDQIQDLQSAWDEVMEGDSAQRRKVRWVPFGSKPFLLKSEVFDPAFPEWLLRKMCAAHKVKPNDLGFTDTVNRAVGDVQAEVQNRIGRKPLVTYLEGIYDSWLQDDLGLPVRFQFETGEEREDKLQEANSHKIYVEMGAESVDEVREKILGLPVDPSNPVPRFVSTRTGLVPLSSVFAVAGKTIDPETLSPAAGSITPIEDLDDEQPAALSGQETPLADVVGAVQRAPAPAPAATAPHPADPAAPQQQDDPGAVTKELVAFARFAKARTGRGARRGFAFTAVPDDIATRLNTLLADDPPRAEQAARALMEDRL